MVRVSHKNGNKEGRVALLPKPDYIALREEGISYVPDFSAANTRSDRPPARHQAHRNGVYGSSK